MEPMKLNSLERLAGSETGRNVSAPAAWRNAVLASPDDAFRSRVRETLAAMRWRVREARGGAEALAHLSHGVSEALLLDSWLPDLEIEEFIEEIRRLHPAVHLILADEHPRADLAAGEGRASPSPGAIPLKLRNGGTALASDLAGDPCRNSLLYALRSGRPAPGEATGVRYAGSTPAAVCAYRAQDARPHSAAPESPDAVPKVAAPRFRVPELVGNHQVILEVSRRIRLVAPFSTPVLVQGPTGSGKEVVARALHRLGPRSGKPFVALNCAAIPEALLETELFGHARGAFTGAVQRRTGRIEAAHGGTLLLDEIGEMPAALQAKLLRFVESGELQRVGENETLKVDVRLVAATHRPLAQLSREGKFRADLYYRLAVFLIQTPPLAAHLDDIAHLVDHFLMKNGSERRRKVLTPQARARLEEHSWPGNVRELEHVLERASILCEERGEIDVAEIEFADDPLGL